MPRGRSAFGFERFDDRHGKNIAEPLTAYRVVIKPSNQRTPRSQTATALASKMEKTRVHVQTHPSLTTPHACRSNCSRLRKNEPIGRAFFAITATSDSARPAFGIFAGETNDCTSYLSLWLAFDTRRVDRRFNRSGDIGPPVRFAGALHATRSTASNFFADLLSHIGRYHVNEIADEMTRWISTDECESVVLAPGTDGQLEAVDFRKLCACTYASYRECSWTYRNCQKCESKPKAFSGITQDLLLDGRCIARWSMLCAGQDCTEPIAATCGKSVGDDGGGRQITAFLGRRPSRRYPEKRLPSSEREQRGVSHSVDNLWSWGTVVRTKGSCQPA
jgi:hypothetical protein